MTDKEREQKMKKFEGVAKDILNLSRDSLIVNMRFIDSAISRLTLTPGETGSTSTNGEKYFFDPIHVIRSYQKDKKLPIRQYLHTIFHCVYRHMFTGTLVDERLWNLACDIAVEHSINGLNVDSVMTDEVSKQDSEIRSLSKKVKYVTAEMLYHHFLDNRPSEEELKKLEKLFSQDDHSKWHDMGDGKGNGEGNGSGEGNNQSSSGISLIGMSKSELAKMWKEVSENLQTAMETFEKNRGNLAGGLTQNLKEVNREKYDYTSFLKKFAVMGEAMKINDEEFDYVYYTYGMQLYENMPLVEPLEYKDVKRIREFAIAIDTSGSVAGELVQRFVQKTYNILKSVESFFSKINLHIIQCDAAIQEDVKITSQEEFDEYIKTMKLHGFGGTDFRPVFRYVDKLIKDKEFTNLKGLIYFTDGFGIFPEKQPDYKTAFIYINEGYENPEVPAWAIKLILEPGDIKDEH